MLTDFTQFVVIWAGDGIFIIATFALAGAFLLAVTHTVMVRIGRWR